MTGFHFFKKDLPREENAVRALDGRPLWSHATAEDLALARAEFTKLSPEEQAEYRGRGDASKGQARDNRRHACLQLLDAEPQPIDGDQQPPQEPEDMVLAVAPQQQHQSAQEHVNIADEWIAGYGVPADDQAIVPVPQANLPPRVNEASPMHQDFVECYLLPRALAAAAGGVPALIAEDPLCKGGAKQGSARFDQRSSVLVPVSFLPVEEAIPKDVQYPKRCGSLCSSVHSPGILSMQKSLQQVWQTVAKHRSLEWKAANVASADIVLVHEVHFSDIADPITVFGAIVEGCGRHAGEPEVHTLAKYEGRQRWCPDGRGLRRCAARGLPGGPCGVAEAARGLLQTGPGRRHGDARRRGVVCRTGGSWDATSRQ